MASPGFATSVSSGMPSYPNNIRALRLAKGLTLDQLAKLAGTSAPQIGRLEKGERRLTVDWMMMLGQALGVPPDQLFPDDTPTEIKRWGEASKRHFEAKPVTSMAPDIDRRRTTVIPGASLVGDRDLPVYASAEGGPDGAMIVTYDPIEWVKRPEPLATVKEGFAIYVVSDSMSPMFRPGDRALVHPLRQPVAGDDGLFIGEKRDGSVYVLIKTMLGSTDREWLVRQYNPPEDFSLPKETWNQAMKIVGKYGR